MAGPSPWSTEVEIGPDDEITVKLMLSLDAGPMREFRPFLDVELDEAHATMLVGQLGFALQTIRTARETAP